MRRTLLALFALSGGCDVMPEPGNRNAAVKIVWRTYDEPSPVPGVVWIARGDCDEGRGLWSADGSTCNVGGEYRETEDAAYVADVDANVWRYLTHQLMHAHLRRTPVGADQDHTDPAWEALPPVAIDALRAAGYVVP